MGQSQVKQQEVNKFAELLNQRRITGNEQRLLKSVFDDKPEPYLALRNLFFGFELDEVEKTVIKYLQNDVVNKLMWKLFLPKLEKDIPVGQNFDLWQTKDLNEANEDDFDRKYDTKVLLLEMIEKGLKLLSNPSGEKVVLEPRKDLPFMIARNSYISYIDAQVKVIMALANSNEISPEEMMDRLRKNSTK